MFAGAGPGAHHHSRKGIPERNVLASLQIVAVFYGARKISGHIFYRGFGVHIADRIGAGGNVSFGAVEQGVKSLVGCVGGRN